MNKKELIDAVAKESGISRAASARVVEAIFEIILQSLSRGQDVTLTDFGTFQVRKRAARTGRNPRSGATISIAAGKTVGFLPSKKVREAVDDETDDPGPSIDTDAER